MKKSEKEIDQEEIMVQGSVSKPSVSAGVESPADIFKGSPQRANNESAFSK